MATVTEANVIEGLAEVVAERLSRRRPVDRLALTKQEAADSLGISVDHLERHVIGDLRVVRSGRLVLIPRAELDRWLDRRASLTLTREEAG